MTEPDAAASRRVVTAWTIGALALTLCIVTVPFLAVLRGRATTMMWDINEFYVPAHRAVWREFRDGHAPWWTPNVYAGDSTLGAGQYGVFYPLHAIYGFFDATTAHRWWFMSHLWLASGTMFAWSRHRWASNPAAIVAGSAYALSGFFILHLKFTPFLIVAAWLPLVFLGIDLVRERWTTLRAATVAVPLALVALAGHPQMLYYSGLGLATYVVVTAMFEPGSRRWVGRVAGALSLGLGLAAVQLLPLLRFSSISVRTELTTDQAFELSAERRHLLTFPFPHLFGGADGVAFHAPWTGGLQYEEVGQFAGATIVVLAIYALTRLWRVSAVRALFAVGLVGILVMLADATPLGDPIYNFLPLADRFRVWARASLLPNIALAMLAGAGVQQLALARRTAVAWFAGAVGALTAVAVAIPHIGSMRTYLATESFSVAARALPISAVLVLTVAVALVPLYRRVGMGAVVAVCAVEVMFFASVATWNARSFAPEAAEAFYDEDEPPIFDEVYDAPDGIDRWYTETYSFRMESLIKDLYGITAFDPLAPKEFTETVGGMTYDGFATRNDVWQDNWLADVLRITTLVLGDSNSPEGDDWRLADALPGDRFIIWNREPRLPEAYLVGAVESIDLPAIRERLLDPDADFEDRAYIEGYLADSTGILDHPGPAGAVLEADVLDSGHVEVDADRDALLVLSYAWQPGWKASVDGHEVEVVRTNGLVLGIPVASGRHDVHVWFEPPGVRLGALITVQSFAILVLAAPVGTWWRRRRASVASPDLRTTPADHD